MKTSVVQRALWVLVLSMCVSSVSVVCGSPLTIPPSSWQAVPYPNGNLPDPHLDQQTGQSEGDLIGGVLGGTYYPSFAMSFDDNDSASLTDGTLSFRARLGGDKNPAGFSTALFVGFDANLDGALDIFVGVNNSGSANDVGIYPTGTGANTGPSTTTIGAPLVTYTQSLSNYAWTPVNASAATLSTTGNDNGNGQGNGQGNSQGEASDAVSGDNLDGQLGTDYYLIFSIPFQDLVDQLQQLGEITFDETIQSTFVVATATQANSLNQDLNGVAGGTNSTLTWSELGAASDPGATASYSPTFEHAPEPGAFVLLLLGGTALIGRRQVRS